jgi:hypothetical protein
MAPSRKTEPKLRLEGEDFDNRNTQTFQRPTFRAVREQLRPNPLFARVAALLECHPEEACHHLAAAMARAEIVPQAFTRVDLVLLRPSILELIDTMLTPEARPRARERLRGLIAQI